MCATSPWGSRRCERELNGGERGLWGLHLGEERGQQDVELAVEDEDVVGDRFQVEPPREREGAVDKDELPTESQAHAAMSEKPWSMYCNIY